MPRSVPEIDPFDSLEIVNRSQPIGIFFSNGDGKFQDATSVGASNPTITVNPVLAGSSGSTENFGRIGHVFVPAT